MKIPLPHSIKRVLAAAAAAGLILQPHGPALAAEPTPGSKAPGIPPRIGLALSDGGAGAAYPSSFGTTRVSVMPADARQRPRYAGARHPRP